MRTSFLFWPVLVALFLAAVPHYSQAQTGWVRHFDDPFDTSHGYHSYWPYGLSALPDGGLLLGVYHQNTSAGDANYNRYLLRVNAAGQVVWSRSDSITAAVEPVYNDILAVDAVPLGQSGYLEGWIFSASAPGPGRYALLQSNAGGAITNTQLLASKGYLSALCQTAGGGVAGCGALTGASFTGGVLFTVDAAGAVLWEKTMNAPAPGWFEPWAVRQAPDGGFFLAGDGSLTGTVVSMVLTKTDSLGNPLWWREFVQPGNGGIGPGHMGQFPNGDVLAMASQEVSIGHYIFRIVRINAAGNTVWEISTNLGLDQSNQLFPADIAITPNGSVFLAGYYSRLNASNLTGFIARLDADGNLEWMQEFDGVSFSRITTLPDGCLAAAGTYYKSAQPMRLALVKFCPDGTTFPASIAGLVQGEPDGDCIAIANDPALPNIPVRISGNGTTGGAETWRITAADGTYAEPVDTGTYQIDLFPQSPYWEVCQSPQTASVSASDTSVQADFVLSQLVNCPYLTVDLSTPFLGACSKATYYVQYSNQGTAVAENAYLSVEFDPAIAVSGATLPWSGVQGNKYTFDLGNIDMLQGGKFEIFTSVYCNVPPGQTVCATAHIYPDSLCLPPNPVWSGASLEVKAQCDGDSVHFTVHNKGNGDMPSAQDFIVIEDDVIMMKTPFQLNHGAVFQQAVAAMGEYLRGETPQVPYHPGHSMPSAWVEGCNGAVPLNAYPIQFPTDDGDDYIEIECHDVFAGAPATALRARPGGIGPEHIIYPNTDLEYAVFFRNTNADTVHTLTIRDTLPAGLDLATFTPGASSHSYQASLAGADAVEFVFSNLALPPANLNDSTSYCFVKFHLSQLPGLADGTVLTNQATAFADLHGPVQTNSVFHTVGTVYALPTGVHDGATGAARDLTVWPNPLRDHAVLRLENSLRQAPFRLELIDIHGKCVRQASFSSPEYLIRRDNLPAGIYLLQVKTADGRLLGRGKIVTQ